MPAPTDLILADLVEKYEAQASAPKFDRLYADDSELGHMLSVLHKRLNEHFEGINGRAKSTLHYWAEPSRELLMLIDDLRQDLHDLKRAGVEVALDQRYEEAVERCQPWLSPSGGSHVPEDFELIDLVRHEPVFTRRTDSVVLANQVEKIQLKMVDSGSYAHVYSYVDPEYGVKIAVKRAKKGISERDLTRFRKEFEIMKGLRFPYIVEVYRYDHGRDEYRMEFCDETLLGYVEKRNGALAVSTRKRIALQFLYGLHYLHSKGYLHRDIGPKNILVKTYDSGAVVVKLSDFGLAKDVTSDFTLTQTELRGTIRDPQLESFRDYGVVNEIYAVGWVLHFVFTGKRSLPHGDDPIAQIVGRCTDSNVNNRYQSVLDLVDDVDRLEAPPQGVPA